MTDRRDDDFRVRPSAPKNRGRAGARASFPRCSSGLARPAAASPRCAIPQPAARARPAPRFTAGRGHTAARFAGAKLTPMSRRVTIKTLLVNQRNASPQSLAKHLRYIERRRRPR